MVAAPLTPSENIDDSTFPSPSSSTSSASSAAKTLITTTRSLSVSFQGESFFYQTIKEKPLPRKPAPESRKSHSENSRATNNQCRRPPPRDLLAKSVDLSSEKKGAIFAAVRLLLFDEGTARATLDGGQSSEADSLSSGGNSETSTPVKPRARGISVPARFLQDTKVRRQPEPVSPAASPGSRTAKKPPAPTKCVASPPKNGLGNAPSIISFAAEVRRGRKGEGRIEEAHLLRLLHNRHLQWRCVNAKANAVFSEQRLNVEKCLYSAWITTSEMHDSVSSKRIKLQLLAQNIKLTSVLKRQMTYLEEWSLLDGEHSSSLSGAIEALKASVLRLPVIKGARVDVQVVKDAVCSAIDIMETMSSSISSLLSKVEGISYFVSELAKLAALEQTLLAQSRDLLSTAAMLHVKQSSLRASILQLRSRPSLMQMWSR